MSSHDCLIITKLFTCKEGKGRYQKNHLHAIAGFLKIIIIIIIILKNIY